MTLVVDTGVLYAAADTRDGDHQASRDLLETHAANDLVVPGPVITETAWLIATRLGAAAEGAEHVRHEPPVIDLLDRDDGTLAQHGSTLEGP